LGAQRGRLAIRGETTGALEFSEQVEQQQDATEGCFGGEKLLQAKIIRGQIVFQLSNFALTALTTLEPIASAWLPSFRAHTKEVEASGLPVRPYLGSNLLEVGGFLVKTLRNVVAATNDLNPRGTGWTIAFKTEHDFQNLFFIALKPWLPGLGREEITIWYDKQEKRADFNLFGSQLIVELKHVRDANTKSAVSKTLLGLQNFYEKHPNVRVVLFAILVDQKS
jgi:hypothetical protein